MLLGQPNSFLGNANPVSLEFANYFKIVFWSGIAAFRHQQKPFCVKVADSEFLNNKSIMYPRCSPEKGIVPTYIPQHLPNCM